MELAELILIIVVIGLLVWGPDPSGRLSPWSHDPHVVARDRMHRRRLQGWSVLFLVSYGAFAISIRQGWLSGTIPITIATIAVWLIGAMGAISYQRWLQGADELIRRIETEAMALGVGLGMPAIFAVDMLAKAGVISGFTLFSVFMAMCGAFGFARLLGYRRYR